MSFLKICELADEFEQKLLDAQPAEDVLDAKTQIPSWVGDPSIWLKAKSRIKKYWKKYDEPYGAVVNVYRMMGGKKKKK